MNIQEILLHVRGDASDAKQELRDLAQGLAVAGRQKAEATLNIDGVEEAVRDIDEVITQLVRVNVMTARPEVQLQAAGTIAELLAIRAAMTRVNSNANVVRGGFAALAGGARDLGSALSPRSVSIGPFTFGLQGLGAVASVVAVSIGTALVGAVAALAASFTQAVLGAGALAVALGGVLGPALAVVVGAFFRYNSAQEQAEKAQQQLTAATQRAKTAQQDYRTAVDAVGAAEDKVAQARQAQRAALQAQRQAEQGLTAAQRDSRIAQQNLNIARAEAERQLIDLRLAAGDAALSEERAILTVQQARRDYNQMLRDGKASALEIRDAELRVREAEQSLRNATVSTARAREDLTAAERRGTERAPGVVQARRDLRDAERGVRDATRDVREAQRNSRKSGEELKGTSRDLRQAQAAAGRAGERLAAAEAKVHDKSREADRASSGLTSTVGALKREFEALLPIVDPFIDAMLRGFGMVRGILGQLGPNLTRFVASMSRAADSFFAIFGNAATVQSFAALIDGASMALEPLAQILAYVGTILTAIGRDAMPFLVQMLRELAAFLGGVSAQVSGVGSLSGLIADLVSHLRSWFNLAVALADVWLAFVDAAAPQGQSLVDSMVQGAKALADWMRSAEGREEIQEFFRDTLPLAGAFVHMLLFELLPAMLKLGQVLAPFVLRGVQAFTVLIDIVGRVIGFFESLGGTLISVLGWFVTFFVLGGKFGLVAKVIRVAVAAIGTLLVHLGDLIGGLVDLFSGLPEAASRGWDGLKRIVGDAVDRIISGFTWLRNRASAIWDTISRIPQHAWARIRSIVGNMVDGLRARWQAIRDTASTLWTAIRQRIEAPVNAVKAFLSNIWNNIRTAAGRAWASVRDRAITLWAQIRDAITKPLYDALNFIRTLPSTLYNLGRSAIEGLINGIRSMAGSVASAVADTALGPIDDVAGALGISSPSKVTTKMGEQVGQGFALGLERSVGQAARAAARMAAGTEIGIARQGAAAVAGASGGSRVVHQNITAPITVPGGGSPNERVVAERLERSLRRKAQTVAP